MALHTPSTYISVCSGVGGLDLGLHAAVPGLEPVVYIEREAHAASVLVARMEEARLPQAPVWDDVCTFDASPLVGLVDLVAGGTPCQNLSLAGKREGLHGDRSRLFFEHVRIARECDAPFFFWENVAGAIGAVPAVAEHLHVNGYSSVVWTTVRASDVGAPHKRERVFLMAVSDGHRFESERSGWIFNGERQTLWYHPHRRGGTATGVGLAHAQRLGRSEGRAQSARQQGRLDAPQRSGAMDAAGVGQADPERSGLEERGTLRGDSSQKFASAQRGGLGVFPPGRDDRSAWAAVLAARPELAPARPQPRVRGLDDGLGAGMDVCVCPREDRLRATGNGVVPQQAALAWRILWNALAALQLRQLQR